MIIMGDANLCSQKWNNVKFLNKNVSIPLRNVLDQNGLINKEVGVTYQSDHLQVNGQIAESALDHVYFIQFIAITHAFPLTIIKVLLKVMMNKYLLNQKGYV